MNYEIRTETVAGREIALPFWEVYGDWSDDPAKLRTDVLYLLKNGQKTAGREL
jgi:hypothetical protein